MGIAKECLEHWYSVNINGRMVQRKVPAQSMQGKDYETSKWYIVNSLSILGLVVPQRTS